MEIRRNEAEVEAATGVVVSRLGAAIAMDYDRVNNDDVGSSSSKVPFF